MQVNNIDKTAQNWRKKINCVGVKKTCEFSAL